MYLSKQELQKTTAASFSLSRYVHLFWHSLPYHVMTPDFSLLDVETAVNDQNDTVNDAYESEEDDSEDEEVEDDDEREEEDVEKGK